MMRGFQWISIIFNLRKSQHQAKVVFLDSTQVTDFEYEFIPLLLANFAFKKTRLEWLKGEV
jgi:hypothetical protein